MKKLLLTVTALVGLSITTAFATAPGTTGGGTASSAMSRDVGDRPAMAGTGFVGTTDQSVKGDGLAPAPIVAKPHRVDPPNLFGNPWGDGGSG